MATVMTGRELKEQLAAAGHTFRSYAALGDAIGLKDVTATSNISGALSTHIRKITQTQDASTPTKKVAAKKSVATKAPAKKATTSRAANKQRTAKAKKTKASRDSRRVKLDFSLTPQDRKTLVDLQAEIDAAREAVAWKPPRNWNPSLTRGSESGTNSYETPVGWVENVPAGDIRAMKSGSKPWAVPEPEVPFAQIRKWAKTLEGLTFQAKVCRLCGKDIEPSHGPELAQVRQLLAGHFKLPYINAPLVRGLRELRFRRLHHLHSLWEDKLAEVNEMMDDATDAEVFETLMEAAQAIFAKAERNRPGAYTLDDIEGALQEVVQLWAFQEEEVS